MGFRATGSTSSTPARPAGSKRPMFALTEQSLIDLTTPPVKGFANGETIEVSDDEFDLMCDTDSVEKRLSQSTDSGKGEPSKLSPRKSCVEQKPEVDVKPQVLDTKLKISASCSNVDDPKPGPSNVKNN